MWRTDNGIGCDGRANIRSQLLISNFANPKIYFAFIRKFESITQQIEQNLP